MANTQEGVLERINPTEQKSDTFQVRDFVINTLGEYPQVVQFQCSQQKCSILDGYKVGESVTVHFNLRGRKWQKDASSKEMIFNTLECWKIERTAISGQQSSDSPKANTPSVQTPKNDVFDAPAAFDSPISVISAGQKYRDREGVVLTIVSTTLNDVEFQSTKAAGVHKITVENWSKSIAPKYTLQEDDTNGVSDLPF